MSEIAFRSALFAEVIGWGAANFPYLPLCFENGPAVDEVTIGPIWLDMEIRWYGANLASVGETPRVRDTGAFSAACYYRESEGTEKPDLILSSLKQLLRARRLGGAVLWAPQGTVPTNLRGWHKTGILLPFTLG